MGALKSLSQPVSNEYLKVTDDCYIAERPETVNSDGSITPYLCQFNIGYRVYRSYEDRLASETDKWIKYEQGSVRVDYLPDLPANWEPINPDNRTKEKIKAMAYIALLAHPAYAEWVTYQP